MSESEYKVTEAPTCRHCQQKMEKLDARHLDWGTTYLWVCYNDHCGFFKRGWQHMMDNYGQLVSYRYMVTPDNGSEGVIPAFSVEYMQTEGKSRHEYEEPDMMGDGEGE